jgi:hypothetical protein
MAGARVYVCAPKNIDASRLKEVHDLLHSYGLTIEPSPLDGVWSAEQIEEILTFKALFVVVGNITSITARFTIGRGVYSTIANLACAAYTYRDKTNEFLEGGDAELVEAFIHLHDCLDKDDLYSVRQDWRSFAKDEFEWGEGVETILEFDGSFNLPIFGYINSSQGFHLVFSVRVNNSGNWSSGADLYLPKGLVDENETFAKLAKRLVELNPSQLLSRGAQGASISLLNRRLML